MHGFVERINEWGYALSQTLQGQLEAGSFTAVLVVFAAGVLTSFTPCVYPMIPVTITYIGGAAAGRRSLAVTLSLVYVAGIAICGLLAYFSLSVVIAEYIRGFEDIRSFAMPGWIVTAPVPLAFFLLAIEFARYLFGPDSMWAEDSAGAEGL